MSATVWDLMNLHEIQDGNAQTSQDFIRSKMALPEETGRKGHQGHPAAPLCHNALRH